MSVQIYVKGDQARRVETAADRVAAIFDGFKLVEAEQAAPEVEVNDNPDAPETGSTSLVTGSEGDSDSNALETTPKADKQQSKSRFTS